MLYHLNDLEADFRAFYRVTPVEILQMSGPQFLALAYRVSAFSGAMAARITVQEQKSGSTNGVKTVESTPSALQNDPALADLIDYG